MKAGKIDKSVNFQITLTLIQNNLKTTLTMLQTDYWKIFNEGQKECEKVNNDVKKGVNPYGTLTEEWKVWNKGWNSF